MGEEAGTDGGEDGFESSCSQQLLPTTHLYSCCPLAIVAHMAPLLASVGDRSSAQHYQTNTKYKTQTQTQTQTQTHMATLAALVTGQVISFKHCLLLL